MFFPHVLFVVKLCVHVCVNRKHVYVCKYVYMYMHVHVSVATHVGRAGEQVLSLDLLIPYQFFFKQSIKKFSPSHPAM